MTVTSEGLYRLLVEGVTDYAIYMLDPTGHIVSWNAGARRFKGYTADEVLGTHFERFYVDTDRAAGLPRTALATAAREGRYENEGWRVRKDGTHFWAHVIIDPIRDDGGTLLGFAKITRDLTERRQAAEALRSSEDQFRFLVQGVSDYAIYTLDSDGNITNWNLGAQRIKGYLPNEIIGKHFSTFYTEDEKAAGEPARGLAMAIRDGHYEKEGWRVRKDGTQFFAHVVIDPVWREDGTLLGYAKITRDITERRAQEQALEVTREALFQSQKLETIGQLTGGVAHDFNNLLMAVLTSLELLGKRIPEDPQTRGLLENAVAGAQRGATLTQRMLAFARRQELKPTSVDVPALVRDMADLLQRSLGPQITIDTRFPLKMPSASVDANQLELVLLNLAVNARDAMPDGGTVVISAKAEYVPAGHSSKLTPGNYVCLSVCDEGEGMDAETLAHATEPFFTTKGIGKGTGLGLSMTHGLAEQSGGRLILTSKPDVGTTAQLWLPEAPKAPANVEEPLIDADAQASSTSPLVVLTVDDDSLILMTTAALLEDLGHVVHEAASAKDALTILRRGEPIDVVITDYAMPGMTGAQLAQAIHAEWPTIPLIIATGYAELPESIKVEAIRLNKPFRRRDMERVLADATARKKA